jgi:hypothetical protein
MDAVTPAVTKHTLASQLLWPEDAVHTIESVELEPSVPEAVEPLVPRLRELAALGDALRSLQAVDGSLLLPETARALAADSARLVQELADADAVSEAEAGIMRLRAEALLEGAPSEEAARREAALAEPQALSVFCGPLCTWRAKTPAGLHTVVATTSHAAGDQLIAQLDATLEEALDALRERIALPDLGVHALLPMQITDLVAAGGEASAFPKHFAYFLPVDEGIADGDPGERKTILFRNVYDLRYERMSSRLAEVLLDGPELRSDVPPIAPLLGWLRAHDVAHGLELPGDEHEHAAGVGPDPVMALHEVTANVYGLLLAITPAWLERQRVNESDVAAIYMAEMLQYMRRGPMHWGDAAAAYMELNFLERNGFVDIDELGRISWETDRLIEGTAAHARVLAQAVIAPGETRLAASFLDEYAWGEDTAAARTADSLMRRLASVPTALAYR